MPRGKPTKMKACVLCGEMFLPSSPASKMCSKDHIAKCPICGKDMIWNHTYDVEPCSKECRKEAIRRHNIEKYGVEHPMQNAEVREHHMQSMKSKYGVEHALQSEEFKEKARSTTENRYGVSYAMQNKDVQNKMQNTMMNRYGVKGTLASAELRKKVEENTSKTSDEIQKKREATCMDRYGVSNVMQNDEVKKRAADSRSEKLDQSIKHFKLTCMDRYGVDNPSKIPEVQDKITNTFIRKYGVRRAIQVPEFRQKMIDTMLSKYHVPYYVQSENYRNNDHFRISRINQKFAYMLEQCDIPYAMEFTLGSKSFDFHVKGTNILIEIDPTYTHNVIGNHWNRNGIPSAYHKEKSELARANGYRCIHVFDWDDWGKIRYILQPMHTRIYARNCQIFKLNKSVTNDFLNNYHLQGTCTGQLLSLGLVYNDELLQIMTFGKSRYSTKHQIELLRLCTKPGYQVIGGTSKLFSFATKDYELYNIVSYCDLSKFTGEVYEKIGMKLIRTTVPQEIWSNRTSKVTANLLRQQGFDHLFNTNYGKDYSNEYLMLQHHWLPVYDCGQAVYEFN